MGFARASTMIFQTESLLLARSIHPSRKSFEPISKIMTAVSRRAFRLGSIALESLQPPQLRVIHEIGIPIYSRALQFSIPLIALQSIAAIKLNRFSKEGGKCVYKTKKTMSSDINFK